MGRAEGRQAQPAWCHLQPQFGRKSSLLWQLGPGLQITAGTEEILWLPTYLPMAGFNCESLLYLALLQVCCSLTIELFMGCLNLAI